MDIKRIPKKKFDAIRPPREDDPRFAVPAIEFRDKKTDPPAPRTTNDFNLIISHKKRTKSGFLRVFKIFAFFLAAVLTISFAVASFFVYKINSAGKKANPSAKHEISLLQTFSNLAANNFPELKSFDDRINILLLGIAGEKKPGQNLTDTIMILSIDTEKNRISLLSLPRDLFAEIPDTGTQTKINSIYQIGLSSCEDKKNCPEAADLIKKTAEEITSLKINYYVVLNFEGFEKVIDAVGGINVMNERDIYDTRYPGANYSYETFELKKGFQHLDGRTALKYARERHNDPEGDFGRAKRQQQVMQAAKNKVFSTKTLFNIFTLSKILEALGSNIKTDIEPQELESFMEISKRLDTENVNNIVIDAWNKESLLKVAHVALGETSAFVLVPKVGNYSEIQETAKNIFNLNEIKRRKEEIQKEEAQVAIINLSEDNSLTYKIRKILMEHLDYKNIEEIFPKNTVSTEKSFVYDLSGKSKPFTLDELMKIIPAPLSAYNQEYESYIDNSASRPDIIIGLGKDLIEKYNIKEATIEEWQNSDLDTNQN